VDLPSPHLTLLSQLSDFIGSRLSFPLLISLGFCISKLLSIIDFVRHVWSGTGTGERSQPLYPLIYRGVFIVIFPHWCSILACLFLFFVFLSLSLLRISETSVLWISSMRRRDVLSKNRSKKYINNRSVLMV